MAAISDVHTLDNINNEVVENTTPPGQGLGYDPPPPVPTTPPPPMDDLTEGQDYQEGYKEAPRDSLIDEAVRESVFQESLIIEAPRESVVMKEAPRGSSMIIEAPQGSGVVLEEAPRGSVVMEEAPRGSGVVMEGSPRGSVVIDQTMTITEHESVIDQPQVVEVTRESMIGQPQVVEVTRESMIGQPQYSEVTRESMIGQPQVVEVTRESMIGQPQVVEVTRESMIGQPQYSEVTRGSMIGQPQVVEVTRESNVIGQPQYSEVTRQSVVDTNTPQYSEITRVSVIGQEQYSEAGEINQSPARGGNTNRSTVMSGLYDEAAPVTDPESVPRHVVENEVVQIVSTDNGYTKVPDDGYQNVSDEPVVVYLPSDNNNIGAVSDEATFGHKPATAQESLPGYAYTTLEEITPRDQEIQISYTQLNGQKPTVTSKQEWKKRIISDGSEEHDMKGYFCYACFTCFFCNLILGSVALYLVQKGRTSWSTQEARRWGKISAIVATVGIIITFVVVAVVLGIKLG